MDGVKCREAIEIIKKNLINRFSLILRAIELRGLKYQGERRGGTALSSEPFSSYELSDEIIKGLTERGFSIDHRPDGIITLSDNNPSHSLVSYWNVKSDYDKKHELRINLAIEARVDIEKRGIVFKPLAYGTFLSPADYGAYLRCFKVVSEIDLGAHPLIRDIVEGDGETIVSWFEMNLAGVRSLPSLFDELAGDNPYLQQLAHAGFSPFSPNPYDKSDGYVTYFLPEYLHAKLFQVWKHQLDDFKNSLACKC